MSRITTDKVQKVQKNAPKAFFLHEVVLALFPSHLQPQVWGHGPLTDYSASQLHTGGQMKVRNHTAPYKFIFQHLPNRELPSLMLFGSFYRSVFEGRKTS